MLCEEGERREPHGHEDAEERCEWTEGRTLVHGSNRSRVARRRSSTATRDILPDRLAAVEAADPQGGSGGADVYRRGHDPVEAWPPRDRLLPLMLAG